MMGRKIKMNKIRVLCAGLIALGIGNGAFAGDLKPYALIIMLDGMRADMARVADMPYLRSVMDGKWHPDYKCASSLAGQNLDDAMTYSYANHSSIICGVKRAKHNVAFNCDVGIGNFKRWPSWQTLVVRNRPGVKALFCTDGEPPIAKDSVNAIRFAGTETDFRGADGSFSFAFWIREELARSADEQASIFGNMDIAMCEERYERFLRELHRRRPETPIVIADQRIYSSERITRTPMNEYLAEMVARLRKESPGWKIYHVRAESMFPKEVDETSVDSPDGHPSDLGMVELADAYQQQIAAALGR